MSEDEKEFCSACMKEIFWITNTCLIYSCYNPVCSKCKYCDQHYTLKQLKEHLDRVVNCRYSEGDFLLNNKLLYYYCGLYENEKRTLENAIIQMQSIIDNGFKALQQVHGKRIPDDVSRLITSFLY